MDDNLPLPPDVPRRRLYRDLAALTLMGVGIAALVVAGFMLAPAAGVAAAGVAVILLGVIVGTARD